MEHSIAMTQKDFMKRAHDMRAAAIKAGDQAYGAVVVKDGTIVGLGPSRVVTNQDPTAHAEMEALRAASATLKTGDLSGCILYSTSPPCAMCEAGASWSNIDKMIATSTLRTLGAPRLTRC